MYLANPLGVLLANALAAGIVSSEKDIKLLVSVQKCELCYFMTYGFLLSVNAL